MEVGEMLLKTASDADTTVPRENAAASLRAPAGPQRNGQGPQWRTSVHFIEAKRSLMKTMKLNMNTFTLLLKLL